ncbi:MAG: DoxX family protein [Alphaproteobacteria bacterium]
MTALTERPLFQKLLKISAWKIRIFETYLAPLALLATRLYVGMEFWRSGTTKSAEGWDHAKDFFDQIFKPEFEKNHVKHWLGMDISFPVPGAAVGAFGTTYAEIALAVLLMAGLAGRAAAFGIFMISLTIELFVYPGTDQNLYWMLLMAILVTMGPGTASIDYFIRRKLLGNGLCDTKKTP